MGINSPAYNTIVEGAAINPSEVLSFTYLDYSVSFIGDNVTFYIPNLGTDTTLKLGGISIQIISDIETGEINFTVPQGISVGTKGVMAIRSDNTTAIALLNIIDYNTIPTITSLVNFSFTSSQPLLVGVTGDTIKINGTNFLEGATIIFGTTYLETNVVFSNSSVMYFSLPELSDEIVVGETYTVTLTNPPIENMNPDNYTVNSSPLNITMYGLPTITSLSSSYAKVGDRIDIYGTNFINSLKDDKPELAVELLTHFGVPVLSIDNFGAITNVFFDTSSNVHFIFPFIFLGSNIFLGSTYTVKLLIPNGNSCELSNALTITAVPTIINVGRITNVFPFNVDYLGEITSYPDFVTGGVLYLLGTNFINGATVTFGTVSNIATNIISSTTLSFVIPYFALQNTRVNFISVTNPGGNVSLPRTTNTFNIIR